MIGVGLILIGLSQGVSVTTPAGVITPQIRQAARTYQSCLHDAAVRIAHRERERLPRYRAFARACGSQRAELIAIFVADNSRNGPSSDAQARRNHFERASGFADQLILSPLRFLDPGPVIEQPVPINIVGSDN